MAGTFASATEFCDFTGILYPQDPSRLQAILLAASAAIRRYTGQTLSQVSGDVVVVRPQVNLTTGISYPLPNAAFGEVMLLPQRPVTAIASIVSNAVTIPSASYDFSSSGIVTRTDGQCWLYSSTVTYTHGYAETTDEFAAIRLICMEAAARAYTLNERSASEAMGGTVMESAGYAPEVFLTQGEKAQLSFVGKAYVG